jgi:competence protein ComEC
LSSGFWLSFGAVGWILYVLSGRHGSIGKIKSAVRIQAALTVGLLPFLLTGFQQASFTAPLANIIAVPVVGLIVVPMVLLGTMLLLVWPSGGNFLVQIAGNVLHLISDFLTMLALFPFGIWQQDSGGILITFTCLASVTLLLMPAGLALRFSGLLLLGPLLFTSQPRPASGMFWLDLLDAGQGLSAVVRTHQHTLVYDTGPKSRSGFDIGEAVVVPFLVSEGIKHIDKLIISHSDNDHQGGARSVFDSIETDSILSGMPEAIDFARSKWCHHGQQWQWEGVRFDVLSPVIRSKGNNASCVLKITAKNGQKLLLTGDIETAIEQHLADDFGATLQANVLVVPHHGSRTSSTLQFINEVEPDIVLFPAGFNNRFGFPRPDIVNRYQRRGADISITGHDGAIRVELGDPGKLPRISKFRQDSQRYWRQPSAD